MTFRMGRPWTQEEEELLVSLYTSGLKKADIAKRMNRSYGAVGDRLSRIRSMGLLSPKAPSADAPQPTPLVAEEIKYLPVEEACAYHAAVVMSQGGFCALSERRLGRNTWAVCLPLVWPKKEQTR